MVMMMVASFFVLVLLLCFDYLGNNDFLEIALEFFLVQLEKHKELQFVKAQSHKLRIVKNVMEIHSE